MVPSHEDDSTKNSSKKPKRCQFGAECKKRTTCKFWHPPLSSAVAAVAMSPLNSDNKNLGGQKNHPQNHHHQPASNSPPFPPRQLQTKAFDDGDQGDDDDDDNNNNNNALMNLFAQLAFSHSKVIQKLEENGTIIATLQKDHSELQLLTTQTKEALDIIYTKFEHERRQTKHLEREQTQLRLARDKLEVERKNLLQTNQILTEQAAKRQSELEHQLERQKAENIQLVAELEWIHEDHNEAHEEELRRLQEQLQAAQRESEELKQELTNLRRGMRAKAGMCDDPSHKKVKSNKEDEFSSNLDALQVYPAARSLESVAKETREYPTSLSSSSLTIKQKPLSRKNEIKGTTHQSRPEICPVPTMNEVPAPAGAETIQKVSSTSNGLETSVHPESPTKKHDPAALVVAIEEKVLGTSSGHDTLDRPKSQTKKHDPTAVVAEMGEKVSASLNGRDSSDHPKSQTKKHDTADVVVQMGETASGMSKERQSSGHPKSPTNKQYPAPAFVEMGVDDVAPDNAPVGDGSPNDINCRDMIGWDDVVKLTQKNHESTHRYSGTKSSQDEQVSVFSLGVLGSDEFAENAQTFYVSRSGDMGVDEEAKIGAMKEVTANGKEKELTVPSKQQTTYLCSRDIQSVRLSEPNRYTPDSDWVRVKVLWCYRFSGSV